MGNKIENIDKNIFLRDPLLASLLLILDSVPFNARFVGDEIIKKEHLPAFTYAVNNWKTSSEVLGKDSKITTVKQEVMMALFKEQPEYDKCSYVWSKTNDIEKENKRPVDLSFKYPFETWKTETFYELMTIINLLVKKGYNRKTSETIDEVKTIHTATYPADVYGFEIINDERNFIYIHNAGNPKLYGVGCVFELSSAYIDCCPTFDINKLSMKALKSQGFKFDSLT